MAAPASINLPITLRQSARSRIYARASVGMHSVDSALNRSKSDSEFFSIFVLPLDHCLTITFFEDGFLALVPNIF
jgi:hypothetical protein